MRTGLALEGGAMRGMFTCGVLDVFMENGVEFDGVAGISAGAAFGCNYKSRQPGRAIRYNMKYCRDWRYCSLRSLIKTGDLYGADFCYREIPEELDLFDRTAFAANPMAFYAGATDVDSGETLYHQCKDGGEWDMTWIRASASMPVASRLVCVDGYRLLDGGITDAVPYGFLRQKGYELLVIVLTQPAGYRKSPTSKLLVSMLREYPALAKAMRKRHEMYNRQMEEIDGMDALVIRPPEPLNIGRTERNPAQLKRVYLLGRAEAESRLGEVRDWISR